jgi:hypothetical protein
MMGFAARLAAVQERIERAADRGGRRSDTVTLVAVSKTIPADGIREALACGVRILGENRVQEAREKIARLGALASWHLVGHLQTNKAKLAVQLFDCIHSLDSVRLAEEVSRCAEAAGKLQRCLVEVNVGDEPQKSGASEAEVREILAAARRLPGIEIEGLMAVPPFLEDPEEVRPFFRKLRLLRDALCGEGFPLTELSMGMTHDFEIAVEEGATLVRIGTALFGPRHG